MAIAKPSILGTISGIVAGTEIAATRNGAVLKKLKPPRRLNSWQEQKAREGWNYRTSLWHTLTTAEVRAWEVYAQNNPIKNRLGQPIYINARAHFMRNMVWTTPLQYLPDYEDPPIPTTGAFTALSASFTEGGPYTVTITETLPSSPVPIVTAWIARFQPQHTEREPSTWIRIGAFPITAHGMTWYEHFIARGVDLIAGERVAFKCRLHYVFSLPTPSITVWETVAP